MFSQVKEKGPRVMSNSRDSILSIDSVRRAFGHMRVKVGRGAMSSNRIEEHKIMDEIARGVECLVEGK